MKFVEPKKNCICFFKQWQNDWNLNQEIIFWFYRTWHAKYKNICIFTNLNSGTGYAWAGHNIARANFSIDIVFQDFTEVGTLGDVPLIGSK